MSTDRGRRTVRSRKRIPAPKSPLGSIRLASGVLLEDGKNGEESAILVGPDGRLQLNRGAVAILRLCDGSRNREEIVAAAMRRSHGHLPVSDITGFLDVALARGWIVENRES